MTVEAGLARSTRRAAPGVRSLSPARLDDAAFLELLVWHGLGRPSTLATIAESLEARGYLARAGGALQVTPLGRRVVAWLDRTFPGTLDAPFTATLEARLEDVEQGRVPWRVAVAGIWTPLERPLGRVVA